MTTGPSPEVVAGYRPQSEAEFSFSQMKDTRVVSFGPMYHWTEHNIRVHVFTCVLALQVAHLMRFKASHVGLDMSVRVLLSELADINETILLYQGDKGRPRAHRMLADTTPLLDKLTGISASAAEIAAIVRVIVPYQAPEGGRVSTSSPQTSCTAAMSAQPDKYACAETLVHEMEHLKLSALLDLVTMTFPDDGQR
jgi:HEXXH motif-containing protein